MERRVGIVGAGISGLLACKYTLSKGFNPIVFETKGSIGGVWTQTLQTTKLQTPQPMFQFSDFPWPASVTEDFPDHDQVLEYIRSYADHFDLLRHIKFNSKVVSMNYEGQSEEEMATWIFWGGTNEPFTYKGKWILTIQDTQNLSIEDYQFNFVILCLGKFSDVPNLPEFPPDKGPEVFQGKVIHSMDYAAMDYASATQLVKGKNVSVVGFRKSGLDITMEASVINGTENPCTVIYNTEHWNVPDFSPWGFPLAFLYLNSFSELLVHKPGEGFLLSLLAMVLSPLRWAFSKFVESHIKHNLRLSKFGMVPEHSFLGDFSSWLVATVTEEFYNRVGEGSIRLKKARRFGFCKEGILLDGEAEPQKTDLVILATGFDGVGKLRNIFASPTLQDLIVGRPYSVVPLYRECIQPRIPQLAVIGFSESISNLFTSEMRCRWITELLDGKFKLPAIRKMEKDIAEWEEYKKRYSGRYHVRSCIGALHIWYNDQLCRDMGWNPKRKKGFIAELFEPYGPLDYIHP